MWYQVNDVVGQSITRIAGVLSNFLPGLLALFVILILTAIVAFIVQVHPAARARADSLP